MKELILDSTDRIEFSMDNKDKIYQDSLSTSLLQEYSAPTTLLNLENPITGFGHALKALSLRFAAENKKIYIIPLTMTSDGLGQSRKGSSYIKSAIDSVKIGRTTWRCWVLDGNSMDSLKNFQEKYPVVLRALLEGQVLLHFISGSDTSTIFEHLGCLDIFRGAIDLDQFTFTQEKKVDYKVFTDISSFDDQFYNENYKFNFISVMNSFKDYPLSILPQSLNWEKNWRNDWNRYSYIRDFFLNTDEAYYGEF